MGKPTGRNARERLSQSLRSYLPFRIVASLAPK